jgi:chaperonin GroEL
MIAREAAENTNRVAGDGTTTTIVLLRHIFEEGHRAVASGMNPILVKKGMEAALAQVVKQLGGQARRITTGAQRRQIATISANNDAGLGKLISDVLDRVGDDGTITVTSANTLKLDVEYTQGVKLNQGYSSHIFINDHKHLSAVMAGPRIIICTDDITMQGQLVQLIQNLITGGERNFLLLANSISGQALAFLAQNYLQGKFTCLPVKLPAFGDYQKDLCYDLALQTGATVLGREEAVKIEDADIEHCGTCEQVVVGRDSTILIGANGDISSKISEVKALLGAEEDEYRKDKLKQRLGRLTGSIANIKVGGASEAEQVEVKYRIEDALNATKSAIEEGIVEGGGMALLKCKVVTPPKSSKEFAEGCNIVRRALSKPLETIAANGGVSGEAVVGKVQDHGVGYNALKDCYEDLYAAGVVDPVKVVKNEIINAVATASILLTSNCAIVNKDSK